MDTATVGVVALSIAIGFSLTQILFWHRRRGIRYAFAMLLSIGIVFGFARYVAHPYIQSSSTDRSGPSELLRIFESLEPAMRFSATPGATPSATAAELRMRSVAVMKRHAVKASDVTITELAKILLTNAQALQRRDPVLCVSYLFPASEGAAVDYSRYLDDTALSEDRIALAAVLKSAADSPRSVHSDDAARGIRTLRKRLSDRYTADDLAGFEQRHSLAERDRRLACRMAIDMYREALELPPPQRAEVLRYLITS